MKSVKKSRLNKSTMVVILLFMTVYANAGSMDTGPASVKKTATFRNDGRLEFVSHDGRVRASITIEIAETKATRAKGLMGREEMDDNVGMLFVYQRVGDKVFWMRNTPLSLDMVFVSEDGMVLNIAGRTRPFSDNNYRSKGPAKYVVEVLSGFCDRYGIREGTRVRWYRH
jgi:uncharacterized protein